jgi:FtsH ternary system domain X1
VAPFTAQAALPYAQQELAESLLAASPLTAVLVRPPHEARPGDADDPLDVAAALYKRPRGKEVLITAFAAPDGDARVMNWRARVLTWLAGHDRDALLDVYLAARLRHGAEWDAILDQAATQSGRLIGRQELARFWAPLAALDKADRKLLRSQPFLNGYRRALDLAAPYARAAAG